MPKIDVMLWANIPVNIEETGSRLPSVPINFYISLLLSVAMINLKNRFNLIKAETGQITKVGQNKKKIQLNLQRQFFTLIC